MQNKNTKRPYLSFDKKLVNDFSDQITNDLHNEGYVFTRTQKGEMYQTRSLRIDLSKFKLNSENRRVLKKNEEIELTTSSLPYADYDWTIGKLGKDFYTTKFGDGTFSANKIKELLTNKEKSNFNRLFVYTIKYSTVGVENLQPLPVGYCVALETNELIHYSYPFYKLPIGAIHELPLPPNLGLGMMLKAILYAQNNGKKYIYLGSAQRPSDTYKLQFEGLEWFDGKEWKNDLEELKIILNSLRGSEATTV